MGWLQMTNKKTISEKPPYNVTEKAADYLAKIVETVTRLEFEAGFRRDIKLRRGNRMRTIHSTLAIEGNTLSLGEVTAIIEGKAVAGKQTEIKEVKNVLLDSIKAQEKHQVEHQVELNKTMLSVLKSLKHANLSRKEIFTAIGMKGDTRAGRRSIEPLLTDGYIEMTAPDKPNSKLQKYRLTDKGKAVLYNI
jgi:Fic family protein